MTSSHQPFEEFAHPDTVRTHYHLHGYHVPYSDFYDSGVLDSDSYLDCGSSFFVGEELENLQYDF